MELIFLSIFEHESHEFSRINRTLVYFFFYWVGKH